MKLNVFIPLVHERMAQSGGGFALCFGEENPEYLIAFNTGAIYNVIAKWVERGMSDDPQLIKETLHGYLQRGALVSR